MRGFRREQLQCLPQRCALRLVRFQMNERWEQRRQWLAVRPVEREFAAHQSRPDTPSAKMDSIAGGRLNHSFHLVRAAPRMVAQRMGPALRKKAKAIARRKRERPGISFHREPAVAANHRAKTGLRPPLD